jgi:hypothetical protein
MNRQVILSIVIAFLAIYGLSWTWGTENWAYHDQINFHIPFANQLIERRLQPFGPTSSASTPGSHLFYALIAIVFSTTPLEPGSWTIAVTGSLTAAATIGLLLFTYQRISNGWRLTPLLLLPVVSSQYFLLPGAYLVTDGLSYFLLACFLSLTQSQLGPNFRQLSAALILATLVMVRQIYLPVAMAMIFGFITTSISMKPAFVVRQMIIALIPLLAFLPFFLHWNGLVPPEFVRHEAQKINIPAFTQSFSILGLLTLPLLPALSRMTTSKERIAICLGTFLSVLLIFLVSATDFNADSGRFGSLIWTFSKIEHELIGTSISIYLLFGIGFATIICALMSDVQTIRLTAIGFTIYSMALAMQSFAWQRYSEVFALILVSLLAARILPTGRPWDLALLAIFYIAWLAATLFARMS